MIISCCCCIIVISVRVLVLYEYYKYSAKPVHAIHGSQSTRNKRERASEGRGGRLLLKLTSFTTLPGPVKTISRSLSFSIHSLTTLWSFLFLLFLSFPLGLVVVAVTRLLPQNTSARSDPTIWNSLFLLSCRQLWPRCSGGCKKPSATVISIPYPSSRVQHLPLVPPIGRPLSSVSSTVPFLMSSSIYMQSMVG